MFNENSPLQRNWPYSQHPTGGGYQTQLGPQDEGQFQQWVQQTGAPFDPRPTADYDMRGFWQDQRAGGQHSNTGMNANDGQMHYSDYFKTPYHESFSAESRFALPGAPAWNELDQLIKPDGSVVFDERAKQHGVPSYADTLMQALKERR